MNIAVRYYTLGGNTKKVADAIAAAVGTNAQDCSVAITEPVDLLFFGGSVYGFDLDEHTKKYIESIDPALVKNIALFGTSAIVKSGNSKMDDLFNKKGINVIAQKFHCFGEYKFMRKGRPDTYDLNKAAEFAKTVVDSI